MSNLRPIRVRRWTWDGPVCPAATPALGEARTLVPPGPPPSTSPTARALAERLRRLDDEEDDAAP